MAEAKYGAISRLGSLVVIVCGIGMISSPIHARDPQKPSTRLSTKQLISNDSGFTGLMDLRPSWDADNSRFFAYNLVELGYRFSKDISLSYQQYFYSFYWQGPEAPGNALQFNDGNLHLTTNRVAASDDGTFHYDNQLEIRVPTDRIKADSGMRLMVRNYFTLEEQVTPRFTFSLNTGPSYWIYDREAARLQQADGTRELTANPVFENLAFLTFKWQFGDSGVGLSLPIYFDSTRYAAYAGAKNDDSWSHILYVYPELTITTASLFTFGFGYQSGNLLNLQDDGTENGNASVGSGTPRLILKTKF